MKSIKKEFIVLGAIIVILLGYLLFQSRDKVHYKVPVLDTVKKENIDKVDYIVDVQNAVLQKGKRHFVRLVTGK